MTGSQQWATAAKTSPSARKAASCVDKREASTVCENARWVWTSLEQNGYLGMQPRAGKQRRDMVGAEPSASRGSQHLWLASRLCNLSFEQDGWAGPLRSLPQLDQAPDRPRPIKHEACCAAWKPSSRVSTQSAPGVVVLGRHPLFRGRVRSSLWAETQKKPRIYCWRSYFSTPIPSAPPVLSKHGLSREQKKRFGRHHDRVKESIPRSSPRSPVLGKQ
ncbi:hypothetical protein VTK26DRAFT_3691 [Humicola hyalothermophila]